MLKEGQGLGILTKQRDIARDQLCKFFAGLRGITTLMPEFEQLKISGDLQ